MEAVTTAAAADTLVSRRELYALRAALELAREFQGATSPNPPVGAAALDEQGNLLSLKAHERAGEAHAEASLIADCGVRGLRDRINTLIVTLEPCNHHGRTPPCTEALLELARQGSLKRVVFGTRDPNPRVQGGGARRLQQAGIQALCLEDAACAELIRGFSWWSRTGRPWVTVKTAFTRDSSMIPPRGKKTFTSDASLRFAHELRRRADAILTGSGTVLADAPLFTVRHVADHAGKKRRLYVLDRGGRVPSEWIESRAAAGFELRRWTGSLADALDELGSQGVLEVLVEAGPTLSESFLGSPQLWNEHVLIRQGAEPGDEDTIERRLNPEAGEFGN